MPPIVKDALEVNVNVASSGKLGQEDLRFTVTTGSSHVVDTAVNTDLVMKPFGPNIQRQVSAENDGRGTGTRVIANLGPGL